MYGEWVRNRPTEGVLSDPVLHFVFVGQSVYGAKLSLVRGGVPVRRANEFAAWMSDCWAALVPSLRDDVYQDKPAFALWVFGPILEGERDHASDFSLNAAEREAWWLALRPLALKVVREGPWGEVDSLLRSVKESPLLAGILLRDIAGLFQALRERTGALDSASTRFYCHDCIECACAAIEESLTRSTDAQEREELYVIVSYWAAPPLANVTAAAAARRIRMHTAPA